MSESVKGAKGRRGRRTPATAEIRTVQVGPHEVEVSLMGEGKPGVPLLMFHGVGADPSLWGDLRGMLERPTIGFRVQGAQLGTIPTLRTYASFVASVLDALDLGEVDALGLSWGGMAVQQLAKDHPDRVRRIVLAATTTGFLGLPARPMAYRYLLSADRSPEKMRKAIAHFYAGDFVEDPTLTSKLGLEREVDAGLYRRQLASALGWTSSPWLSRLPQPALVMHGDDDPVCPIANARLMARLLRRAEFVTMPGGGHLFLLTRPEECADAVDTFLSDEELSDR